MATRPSKKKQLRAQVTAALASPVVLTISNPDELDAAVAYHKALENLVLEGLQQEGAWIPPVTLRDKLQRLSPRRRRKVRARAAQLIADELDRASRP